VYTRRDGLLNDSIFRLFEDSRGDLWMSIEDANPSLTRWRRAKGAFEPIETGRIDGPSAFAEDTAGNVWMGFYEGGLARYRRGAIEHFGAEEGVPRGLVYDLHLDQRGRLWVATGGGGLARIDDPAALPRPLTYTQNDGLSSDAIYSLTEDRQGHIYVGTSRGVDRLDPETGRIRRYSTAEGLASNAVYIGHADAHGDLWFGTYYGLSRLTPGSEHEPRRPAVFIGGLRIGGAPHPVSQFGETAIAGIELEHDERRMQIDYAGVSLAPGEVLHYQTRLDGVDEEWNPPTEERSVLYGNLGPGSYRFLVRAINAEGMASRPASVAFTILAPFWQRPWFLAPVLLLAALGGFVIYRYRVQRLVAVERVRTQIATDLHDDLGARLSRVSIMSETASWLIGRDDAKARQLLGDMGETTRRLIDATGDIGWSIDPRRDDVRSLVARIRHFASDTLDGRGISWSFDAPPDGFDQRLDPEQRRHLLLVFQEAIHNVIRHSGASRVELDLRIADGRVEAEIWDDGRGFAATGLSDEHAGGRGLLNMRERARALGGVLEVESEPGRGTRIRIRAPLTPPRAHTLWRHFFPRGPSGRGGRIA
jgi:signal transduction histidine kinase